MGAIAIKLQIRPASLSGQGESNCPQAIKPTNINTSNIDTKSNDNDIFIPPSDDIIT